MLSWSATLGDLALNTTDGTDAHVSLSVSGKGVHSSEGVAARTGVWLCAGVDLGMSLQVMAADEPLVAVVALELAVVKVSLHVGFDVLLPAETLVTIIELTDPLAVIRIRALDVLSNVIQGDVCLLNGSTNAGLEVEIRDGHASWGQGCSDW